MQLPSETTILFTYVSTLLSMNKIKFLCTVIIIKVSFSGVSIYD